MPACHLAPAYPAHNIFYAIIGKAQRAMMLAVCISKRGCLFMRIAIASSGLGHVARGIETWAADTAFALALRGADVTLFSAGRVQVPPDIYGRLDVNQVSCFRRNNATAQRLATIMPSFLWRWGLNSEVGWEQFSFWLNLWPRLRTGGYHILHVQDPMLAFWCRAFRQAGLLNAREILGHGTEEPVWFLARFPFVQQLAPWHLKQALIELQAQGRQELALHWTAIPNFVDTNRFHPQSGQPSSLRRELGIPESALVVGSVAAIKKSHKRIDYFLKETGAWLQAREAAGLDPAYIIVAGARHAQSDQLFKAAEALMPGRAHLLTDLPRDRMPELYQSLDVFVLCSLFEMMPIAVLEALASGLPVVANQHPVLAWMNGAPKGGACLDMSRPGALAEFLWRLKPQWIQQTGTNARAHAEANFAQTPVVEQYMAYYRRVLAVA